MGQSHQERGASESVVTFRGALAQGKLPPHFQRSHTPIKGFDCAASEYDQRAARGIMKERRKEGEGVGR